MLRIGEDAGVEHGDLERRDLQSSEQRFDGRGEASVVKNAVKYGCQQIGHRNVRRCHLWR